MDINFNFSSNEEKEGQTMSNQAVFKSQDGNDIIVSLEIITPEKASEYLGFNTNNRLLKRKNVEKIKSEIDQDLFFLNGQAIIFDSNGVLADGQTRLTAISSQDKSVESIVVRGVNPNIIMDEAIARSAGDNFVMRHGFSKQRDAVSTASAIKMLLLYIHKKGYGNTGSMNSIHNAQLVTNYKVEEFLSKNKESIFETIDFVRSLEHTERGIIPFALQIFFHYLFKQYDAELANSFMDTLVTGDNQKRGTAESEIRKWIQKTEKSGPDHKPSKSEIIYTIVRGFKAKKFNRGQKINSIRHKSNSSEDAIPFIHDNKF